MDVRTDSGHGSGIDPALDEARARWRRSADRLWPIATADGEAYRQAAELVGLVLAELRRRADSVEALLALDADPRGVLAVLDGETAGSSAPAGSRAMLEAACAIRGDELVAAAARERRVERIAAARRGSDDWVELDDGPLRSVEMHLPSGLALVATADPYAAPEPFALGEVVLDVESGDPVGVPAAREAAFADRADWLAARARWRTEIGDRGAP